MKLKLPIILVSIIALGVIAGLVWRKPAESVVVTPDATGNSTSTAPINYSDEIHIFDPEPDMFVERPLRVIGEARGNWYFEASFPAKLLDANGKVLAEYHADAKSNWMTADFVPFIVNWLDYRQPDTATGTLILKNDNPSGDPTKDKEIRIPVSFITKSWITSLGKPIELHAGESVVFKDSIGSLQLTVEAIHDSRCKPNVQCVWAGEVSADVTIRDVVNFETSKPVKGILNTLDRKNFSVGNMAFVLQDATENTITIKATENQATM